MKMAIVRLILFVQCFVNIYKENVYFLVSSKTVLDDRERNEKR